jgi:hypothetical protein
MHSFWAFYECQIFKNRAKHFGLFMNVEFLKFEPKILPSRIEFVFVLSTVHILIATITNGKDNAGTYGIC